MLLEEVKCEGSIQQLFTGFPFVILGIKQLDCTHGVDRCTSTKKKSLVKKLNKDQADLVRNIPPFLIFLLQVPIFCVQTDALLIHKDA